MNYATINDFDLVWKAFNDNKEWFPHVRKSHVRNRLESEQVIFEDGIVITHKVSKANRPIGRDCDIILPKGTYQIHQIINTNKGNGNAQTIINKFFDFIKNDVYLTVRKENTIANRFYEKVGMELVGQISWSNKSIQGNVWKKKG